MVEPAASLTEQLAAHLCRLVPFAMRQRARLHLLDWLGCAAGARMSDTAALQRRAGGSAIERATWLGNVLEMDDIHRTGIVHPGPVIWPAALRAGARMDACLEAGVRGYEAMVAVAATLDAHHYAFWHPTATAGSFGAAAAAASLLALDAAATADALGLAGSVTGGLWQMRHAPGDGKQWHLAHARATGMAAAHHARHGARGPRQILEGPQGLYAAACRAPRPMILGKGWRIEEVSFKPWGACRHAHPTIDAALALKDQGKLSGEIIVGAYRDALTFCDRADPQSVVQAKFSLQHAVAIVMARGVPQLADFEPEAIAALAPERALVRVVEEPALTAAYPEHFGARVTSTTGSVLITDTFGDPERPMADADIVAKARTLMAWGGIDAAGVEAGIAAVLEADDTAPLFDWLEAWL
ncbi:MmgE/PrpD family protein [Sphingomonas pokkalii]|uniref:MmgE/PrpD family protein n=1 Tax=Sphingomonas pokkalii TaxID=2175090 RepID=A0A2U0SH91_9SPHN|nr:MmgE/PrpD family protein [Sphingomonas pokkalii]PVX30691.1 MmgE/PrpD family protein [Sphingomonas pokkalii]